MLNRSMGAMLGFAVGDALGAQLVGVSDPGHVPLLADQGLRGEANTLQLLLAARCLRSGGMAPDAIGARFGEHLERWYHRPNLAWDRPSRTSLAAAAKLCSGERWSVVGNLSSDGADPLLRAIPVGICFAPGRVGPAARVLAVVTHAHVHALAAAHATAFLISHLCRGRPLTPSLVTEAASIAGDNAIGEILARLAEETMALGTARAASPDAARAGGRTATGALELALGIALRHTTDAGPPAFESAVEAAARIDGRGDTVAALTGAFLGATFGAGAVKRQLIDVLEGRDELVELARALVLRSEAPPAGSSGELGVAARCPGATPLGLGSRTPERHVDVVTRLEAPAQGHDPARVAHWQAAPIGPDDAIDDPAPGENARTARVLFIGPNLRTR